MNQPVLEKDLQAQQRLSIVDCDIHPTLQSGAVLHPYLSARWREHLQMFGSHMCQGLTGQVMHPRMMASGQRADAYPARGGPPGSDLELMQRQHLDVNGVDIGMLVPTSGGTDERNLEFGEALSAAMNDWQLHDWFEKEPRLRPGILVPQENAAFAAREIERRAVQSEAFRQVLISPKSSEPLGRRRYWPIYAAAEASGLPLGLHPAAFQNGNPSSGTGWGTYYMQEHYAGFGHAPQEAAVSLILEGVFELFPKLKVVLIESGFTWAPALGWRMDKHWERMRKEVPHLKRPPSEYLREHFWFCTQPIEEPEQPHHIVEIIESIGWDRILFSTDYPHWDFDDPRYALKFKMTDRQRAMILRENAKAVYRM